jgi:hypothetical protein
VECSSRVTRKCYARFLEGWARVIAPGYSAEEELDQTVRPIARSLQGRAGRQRTVLEPLEKCIHARKSGAETVRQRCICQH